jgi:DUF971 family protein/molybdopterin converting factor small subunit
MQAVLEARGLQMSQQGDQTAEMPTGIKLHKVSRYLEISYASGEKFNLPCEYLRAFSPAVDEKGSREMANKITVRKDVSISAINPVGSYAIQIVFDDGHETGIYSWARLYDMALNVKSDWEDRDKAASEKHKHEQGERTITILYFAELENWLGLESETITLAEEVKTIDDLIPWLMTRRGEWEDALAGTLKITVNRKFVGMADLIVDGDEIALDLVTE